MNSKLFVVGISAIILTVLVVLFFVELKRVSNLSTGEILKNPTSIFRGKFFRGQDGGPEESSGLAPNNSESTSAPSPNKQAPITPKSSQELGNFEADLDSLLKDTDSLLQSIDNIDTLK